MMALPEIALVHPPNVSRTGIHFSRRDESSLIFSSQDVRRGDLHVIQAAAISLEPTLRGLRANNLGTCRGLSGILNAAERLQPS